MGNIVSSASTPVRETVLSESETMSGGSSEIKENESFDEEYLDAIEDEARQQSKEDEMIEFRRQLSIKREQRRQILDRHKYEKLELEKALNSEKKVRLELCEKNKLLRELLLKHNIAIPENCTTVNDNSDLSSTIAQMREEFETLKSNNNKLRRDLVDSNNSLQRAYSDMADLNSQNIESMKQISALKEVVSVSKTMIALREQQLDELKNKLSDIEQSLADREASMLSTDLRKEYERQLQNIRTLRGLYEERARLAEVTRQSLVRELDEQKLLYQAEVTKSKKLSDRVKELEDKVDALVETIDNKNSQISTCKDESIGLKAEMSIVNKLFSEVLLGYKTKNDLDKLVHRLEENHGILTQMAERENDAEASTALPKLLLEIVNQIEEEEEAKNAESRNVENENEIPADNFLVGNSEKNNSSTTTAEEIVQNLPKVWRVLTELLSHQNVSETSTEKVSTCYKSVETKTGPVLVPSVSQTYIRLKDLIIEKLALIKEVNRMKQLNSHLETRLEEQERRLCLVTTELGKTWHVVGRLRRHHHQLHTHEKILKYELQQKRKLLNELKEELEYCREKWEQAREKNTQSERDWRTLRAEFTSRKTKLGSPSLNNSGESGYSDERPSDESSDSNDESEYLTESPIRCKKKLKKSFETIIDSSTDFNLAAEREDPVSDMLDVADLPLDTHDDSHSENISRNELVCEETEDEVGDINGELGIEDTTVSQNNEPCTLEDSAATVINNDMIANYPIIGTATENPSENLIDPKEILKNVKLQNERLSKKDKKLEELEKSSSALLQKAQHTVTFSEEINKTLDRVLNRPTTSREVKNVDPVTQIIETEDSHTEESLDNTNNKEICENVQSNSTSTNMELDHSTNEKLNDNQENTRPSVDFKAVLESVKKQDERLAKRDKRFEELESGCSEVLNSMNSTLRSGDNLNNKLDLLHTDNVTTNDTEYKSEDEDSKASLSSNGDEAEPSTSSEADHEARFAARDLRLKRLEEQTKSLVNKVNNTTSKGVKIHYKLEELHNIYGSENSRAGTPSGDNEDKNEDEAPLNE